MNRPQWPRHPLFGMWRGICGAPPATRHVVFGSSLAGFVGYGMVLWLPAFFVRSHGLSQTEVGFTLALMSGVVGGIGTFSAGKLADVLGRRDERWFAWVVAIGKAGLVPFLVWFFLTAEFLPAMFIYLVPAFSAAFISRQHSPWSRAWSNPRCGPWPQPSVYSC